MDIGKSSDGLPNHRLQAGLNAGIVDLASVRAQIVDTPGEVADSLRFHTNLTLGDLAEAWVSWSERNCALSTSRQRACYLGWAMCSLWRVPAESLTPADVEKVKAERVVSHAPRSINHFVKILKGCYRWGLRQGLIGRNPIEHVDSVVNDPREARALSDEQVQAAFEAGDEAPPLGNLLRFLYHTGLRIGEAANLTWKDYDGAVGVVTLRRHKTLRRTGKPRIVPLSGAARAILDRQTPGAGRIFGLFPASWGQKWRAVRRDVPGLEGVTFHRFRHTFVSRALAAGAQPWEVQRYVGHASTLMTLFYASVEAERLRGVAERVK